jgi:hypothetical protein
MQRGFQFLTGSEVMALKNILNPTVEPLSPSPGR